MNRAWKDFPVGPISDLAQRESWRKEVYRPVYHIHKWWAKRLGTVFRATLLAATLPDDSDLLSEFYRPRSINARVYDPFMGGGTIVGEALKLGCSVIGRDINPVAYNVVRAALAPIDRNRLIRAYEQLESDTAPAVQSLYRVRRPTGGEVTVLYYFWVKFLLCPSCGHDVELFSSYIFSKNAYPARKPEARILCPSCRSIFVGRYDSKWVHCPDCSYHFDASTGPAHRAKAECDRCGSDFRLAETARAQGRPPDHRQYAKVILDEHGRKRYESIWPSDLEKLDQARAILATEEAFIPDSPIAPGYNTKQVLNYGYRSWREFFNTRQLAALSRLARGIMAIPDIDARAQLAILFSGTLEFNNMFASFKGEGTGAVRHMFAHHILKPERTPLEANPWGTPSSSGSFSTLFRSRLLRALEYRESPFEVATETVKGSCKTTKRYGTDHPYLDDILITESLDDARTRSLHLSAGSSQHTDIPSASVDLVLTDPPFFDNVHYSELADFFYIWQAPFFGEPQVALTDAPTVLTTRSQDEVQDTSATRFSEKLAGVFSECARVMKPHAQMIFSYHHSRSEGWAAVVQAVRRANLRFQHAYPVVSEMAVATPKAQAKEPINLDIMFVCGKSSQAPCSGGDGGDLVRAAQERSRKYILEIAEVAPAISRNDIQIVYRSQLIVALCAKWQDTEELLAAMDSAGDGIEEFVDSVRLVIGHHLRNKEARESWGTDHFELFG